MSDELREREIERLLGSLPALAARPEFRSNLRERFLAGAASAPAVDVLPDERSAAPRAHAGRNWKPWIALAAAAAIAVVLWLSKPAPRHWQVLPGSDATAVLVNGESIPATETERIGAALNDARSVLAQGGRLRLAYRDQYALELPDAARVDFAPFGNTGGVDAFSLALEGSALRVVTGPGFHGHELHVHSGAANLHITGTAFAIDGGAAGVCVCGLAGRIGIVAKNAPERPLEAGKQCWFPAGGGALAWGEAHPEHVAPVRELESAASGCWRP